MRSINLLPPEAAQRARSRRKVLGYLALGTLYLALLGLVAFWWSTKATDAEDRLAAQQQTNTSIQQQIVALAPAEEVRQVYEAGATRIQSVLATEVAWGRLLNDLARVIPDRVWLSGFTGTASVSEENPALFGQVQLNGTAFDYPDTASWLRVLDSDQWPALGGGWVNSTQVSVIGEVTVVDFNSVASLTRAGLSDRASERVPEVNE